MPKRIYVGSHDGVDLLIEGQVVSVAKGASVDVPEDVAKEMDKSAAWSTTTSTGKAAGTSAKEQ